MAIFTFDKADDYVSNNDMSNKINFLKIPDHGDMAKVRFMYGPGETFQGMSVHNVSTTPGKPKHVPCLREPGQMIEVCPLCKAGNKTGVQFYIPVYVISMITRVNGVAQEQNIGGVYIFQRGKTFSAMLASVVRQCAGTPLVNNVFNIVRNGKAGDQGTTYTVEFVSRDNVGMDSLPPVPEVLGSYILPNLTAEQMVEKYINPPQEENQVTPRTIQANNTFGNGVPAQPPKFTF